MNFEAAITKANEDAEGFVMGGGTTTCPIKSAGLIVVVIREDTNEVVEGAGVTIGDHSMHVENGQAKFLPIKPGKQHIKGEAPLTKETEDLGTIELDADVRKNTCAVIPLALPVLARPAVKILWLDDGKGVEKVNVSLSSGENTVNLVATNAEGLATFTGTPIKAGPYDCTFTFPGDVKYLIHNSEGAVVDRASIKVKPVSEPFTFKIRRTWVKVNVECAVAGKTERIDVKVKLKSIDEELQIKKAEGAAEAKNIPFVDKAQKCEIETVVPDGTDVYEFVEIAMT